MKTKKRKRICSACGVKEAQGKGFAYAHLCLRCRNTEEELDGQRREHFVPKDDFSATGCYHTKKFQLQEDAR
ncbi:MAG TPA: hypothetical protein VHC95_06960 [Opitutales bacterium]|nr:hypothetical protein [Opitutales bacterium]